MMAATLVLGIELPVVWVTHELPPECESCIGQFLFGADLTGPSTRHDPFGLSACPESSHMCRGAATRSTCARPLSVRPARRLCGGGFFVTRCTSVRRACCLQAGKSGTS